MKKFKIEFGDKTWNHTGGNNAEECLNDLVNKISFANKIIPNKYKLVYKEIEDNIEVAIFECTYKRKKREIYLTELK